MGLAHPGAQIVRDNQCRHTTEEGKGTPVGADPVRQTLCPGRLSVGVIGSAEDGHKDLRLTDLARAPIHHRHGLAGIIHKQLLAGTVVLAHDHIQLALPGAVVVIKPAVLIALGMCFPVLLPEQEQGDTFAFELLMRARPVGQTARLRGQRWRWRKQLLLQDYLIQIRRQRPGQAGLCGTAQVFPNRRTTDSAGLGNLPIAQALGPFQAQYLFDLSQG